MWGCRCGAVLCFGLGLGRWTLWTLDIWTLDSGYSDSTLVFSPLGPSGHLLLTSLPLILDPTCVCVCGRPEETGGIWDSTSRARDRGWVSQVWLSVIPSASSILLLLRLEPVTHIASHISLLFSRSSFLFTGSRSRRLSGVGETSSTSGPMVVVGGGLLDGESWGTITLWFMLANVDFLLQLIRYSIRSAFFSIFGFWGIIAHMGSGGTGTGTGTGTWVLGDQYYICWFWGIRDACGGGRVGWACHIPTPARLCRA